MTINSVGADRKPQTIEIRRARSADIQAFLGLVDALADYEKLAPPTPEAKERLARDGFGSNPLFDPYIVMLEGVVVGYAIVIYTYSSFLARPTLYLEDLFVLPEARRRGVGKAVFRYLAGLALQKGCGRVEWMVLDWNEPAIDFYEGLGATRLREWYGYRLSEADIERLAAGS